MAILVAIKKKKEGGGMRRIFSFGAQDGFSNSLEAPGFLFQDSEKKALWLIDVPASTNLLLQEQDFSVMDLTGILITHLHSDHVTGLVDLIQLRMLCLKNRELFKTAGYYKKVAVEVLPIYVLGYELEWWQTIEKLLDFNCGLVWRDYHQVVSNEEVAESERSKPVNLEIAGLKVEIKRTKHDVRCYGLKIADFGAISGDAPYDEEYLNWLTAEVQVVFHEAGYGGSHLRPEFFETVFKAHGNLHFYHAPFPVIPLLKAKSYRVAEKRWYVE